MIAPRYQWCQQIDVTNACNRACSNCTRLVGHAREPFYMSESQFYEAAFALREFPEQSPANAPDPDVPHKVIGVIGGEPLMHPEFARLCAVMRAVIPDRRRRGLWTGLDWPRTRHAHVVHQTFGYVNNNRHETRCEHSPVLVAIGEVIDDPEERKRLIDNCWLQRKWAGTITPKGFFFCEVAGALDMAFNGPGGLPIDPECWRRPLDDFATQIETWCERCGIAMNLSGRLDNEGVDDITPENIKLLRDSPRVQAGRYVIYDGESSTVANPWRYLQ